MSPIQLKLIKTHAIMSRQLIEMDICQLIMVNYSTALSNRQSVKCKLQGSHDLLKDYKCYHIYFYTHTYSTMSAYGHALNIARPCYFGSE